MTKNSLKTEIQLNTVQLISSLFEWPSYSENPKLQDFDLDLEVTYDVRADFLDVYVNVCLENDSGDILDDFYLEVEMLGVFKKVGTPKVSDEAFAKVNAVEIIFPYIRKHIWAVSLGAGFTPIILPSVNFQNCFKNPPKKVS